nr:187-kDa microtubule-associated protein AIR9 isoform X1 [Ipomoea batatas]
MDGSSPRYTEGAVEEAQSPELEKPTVGEDNVEKPQKQSSAEDVKTTKNVKQNSRMKNAGLGKKAESMNGADSNSCGFKSSTLTKPTLSSASRSSTGVPVARRNSTGGLPDKQPTTVTKRSTTNVNSVVAKKPTSSAPDPVRRSLPEIRRSSLPSANGRSFTRSTISETRKSVPASPAATPKASSSSDTSKYDSAKKSSIKPSSPSTSMRSRESTSFESTGSSGSTRKVVPKLSSLAARSPSVNSGSRTGSLSTSLERSTAFSSRKKTGTTESWDSRLIMLPQVEIKAGDDVKKIKAEKERLRCWLGFVQNLRSQTS